MAYTIFDYCNQLFAEQREEEARLAAEKARRLVRQRAYWAQRKAKEKAESRRLADQRAALHDLAAPQRRAKHKEQAKARKAIQAAAADNRQAVRSQLRIERARAQELTMVQAVRKKKKCSPQEALQDALSGADADTIFAELMKAEPLRARAHAYAMRVALNCMRRLLQQQALCGCCSAMNEPIYASAGAALKNAARLAS